MERFLGTRTIQSNSAVDRPESRLWNERIFVWAVIAAVLAATSLPYLYAYLSTPTGKQFMGIMLDVPDHGQYFSWMRELTHANLSANKLTPEPNEPIFFNLLWWGLGRIRYGLGLSVPVIYQLLRLFSGGLFLWMGYQIAAWFFPGQTLARRTAFLIMALTSGFGWVLVVIKYLLRLPEVPFPNDLYIAEGNTFLSILGYPHFIAAALYILVFFLVLHGERRGQLRYAVAAGLVALFFGWQHAYDLVLVYGILGTYALLRLLRDRQMPWYLVWSGLIVGIISVWPALYSVWLTTFDPLWKEVLAQFANAGVFTPNLLHLPILMGPAFLLALYTVVRRNPLRLAGWEDKDLFILAWFLANAVLIYIPTDFQIHMLNGWQVPIALLATWGLFRYLVPPVQAWWERRRGPVSEAAVRRWAAAALLLVVVPTNLYLLVWRFVELSKHDYPYYLYTDEVEAMAWLETVPGDTDVVLSSLSLGQYVPALTGKQAFLAHWAQTADFYTKKQHVYDFFSSLTPDSLRIEVLRQYGVDFVLYGPVERSLGDFSPAQSSYLELVYSSPEVEVYQVVLEEVQTQ